MPIKGLTDRDPRHLVLGKIRKGGEKQTVERKDKNGKPYAVQIQGEDLGDVFRVTSQDPEILKEWEAVYAKSGGLFPRGIGVIFPFATVDENFTAWYEEWKATSLIRRCDGEQQHIHLTDKNTYSKTKIPCLGCPLIEGKTGCKQTGTLRFLVPAIKSRLGVFELETHSKWDIINIVETLLAVETMFGTLQGIPMVLYRETKSVSTPAFKEGQARGRADKSFVKLRLRSDFAEPIIKALESATVARIQAISAAQEASPLDALPTPTALLSSSDS